MKNPAYEQIQAKKPGEIQLSEEELKDVSGGGLANGQHIKEGTISVAKSGADQLK